MPPEMDDERIAELRRFLSTARVEFSTRAIHGKGHKEILDLGLHGLFTSNLSLIEKEKRLLSAMVDFLSRGDRPNRLEVTYGTVYEFRFNFLDKDLYIKTHWPPADAANPVLEVLSVKLQD